jgi:hypothetical protein
MALEELFEEAERVKLRFVAGFDRLRRKGLISEAQFEELVEIIDHLDDFSEEELAAKLGTFIDQVQKGGLPEE